MKTHLSLFGQVTIAVATVALATTASAQNPRRVPTVPNHDAAPAADRQFAMNAARGGMMEVAMGRMAERRSKSDDVRRIGSRMVADHSRANSELISIAQRKGIQLPGEAAKMSEISGEHFDRQYLLMMIQDHKKDLAEFQTEAKTGQDPELRAFAAKTSNVIKKHLELVEEAIKGRK